MYRRINSLLLSLLLMSGLSWGLDEDRNQPIQVTADSASYNEKTGVAFYHGNVLVIQGTLHLWADELQIQTDKDGKVQKAYAKGLPARYQQIQDPKKGPVQAQANEIYYDMVADEVTLVHNAHITQDSSSAQGSEIHYHIARQHIDAKGDSTSRVFLVFPPQQSGSNSKNNNPPPDKGTANK